MWWLVDDDLATHSRKINTRCSNMKRIALWCGVVAATLLLCVNTSQKSQSRATTRRQKQSLANSASPPVLGETLTVSQVLDRAARLTAIGGHRVEARVLYKAASVQVMPTHHPCPHGRPQPSSTLRATTEPHVTPAGYSDRRRVDSSAVRGDATIS